MKTCTRCGDLKPIEDFCFKNKANNIRITQCKACTSLQNKKFYQLKRSEHIKASSDRKLRNKQLVWDYLKLHPCTVCNEPDPTVLEFHHRDPAEKSFIIGHATNSSTALDKLKAEIAKCDVLCANCHRRHTAIQFGWHRGLIK